MSRELKLRYGMNPHQAPARVIADGPMPIQVLSGAPGMINVLDALNAWQLVRELRAACGLPAAASFKHVSPSGAALGLPLTDADRAAYFTGSGPLSPLAAAYARARGTDRLASFGDLIALSDPVDASAAALIRQEVSDGVIAPAYDADALALLRGKRGGTYLVLAIDPGYEPDPTESRTLFGLRVEQQRNDAVIGPRLLERVVTTRTELPAEARRDLLLALVTLKYTQSNSVCLAKDGQTIGVGAGQQSRVDCVRLAASKAERWWLRRHPRALGLRFVKGAGRPDRDNALDAFVRGN
ncbi:MAG: phosphoribosylaminoimidazolecarboxamide formyltransferase, partial [Chloroflexi bacterium]|nr:phosphoribosylaminoimidazolecarboxamide formyltransferase [Chloroflexota bacterium]